LFAFVMMMGRTVLAVDPLDGESLSLTDDKLGTMPYRLYKPQGYKADGPKLPLIVFLHGAGERGTDNTAQVVKYIGGLLNETASGSHRAIVVAPQAAPESKWVDVDWGKGVYTDKTPISPNMQLVMRILDKTIADEAIDPSRVYVTGISMGGYGAWDAIARFPDRFAAAVPLSGGGNLESVDRIKARGIWAFHGDADGIVPVSGSDDMIKALRDAGAKNAVYSRVPRLGHEGWGGFYEPGRFKADRESGASRGKTLYDWLFAQRLPAKPAKSAAAAGATQQ